MPALAQGCERWRFRGWRFRSDISVPPNSFQTPNLETKAAKRATLLLANFLAMMVHDGLLRGSALVGRIADGHYFVGARGRYTEVSQSAFEGSHFHGVIFFIAAGVSMFVLFFLVLHESTKSN